MKVLLICPFLLPNIGGVEAHLQDLTSFLTKNGHEVTVSTYQPLTTNAKGKFQETSQNLKIYRIPWVGKNLFPRLERFPTLEYIYLFPPLFLFNLFYCLRNRRDIDLISAHGFVASIIGTGLTRIFGIPSVATVHTIYDLDRKPFVGKLVGRFLRHSTQVLTVAQKSKDELVRAGVPPEKIVVFTYWVNQTRFSPMDKNACKQSLGWGGKFIVLFVGRLIRAKGIDILVRSTESLLKGISIAFVTTGTHDDFLKVIGQEGPNVIYIGPVEYSRLPMYYNAADILAVPSLFEGFARVNLEAMSCGTAVVASNVGCLPEVFGDNSDTLIEPTPEAFARLINYFFINPEALRDVSLRYRSYALQRFGVGNANLVEETYYKAVESGMRR